MKISLRHLVLAGVVGVAIASLSGCDVRSDGYGGGYANDGVDVGLGLDYYEPYGYGGDWGSGYYVGPSRGHDRGHDHDPHHGGGHPPPSHAFRGASPGRSMPSIPSGARGGGAHGRGH
jgi:hypothetical protein